MNDNEFLLQDRLQKIRQIIGKYGEDNFYLSFSGGKDSTVLSALLDMALPDNKIPRVYANTGIEYRMIVDFVRRKAEADDRVVILEPTVKIKTMLEREGYPFKSKEHSLYVKCYQNIGEDSGGVKRYLYPSEERKAYGCPKILRYQFKKEFSLKVSPNCCNKLKKEPMRRYEKNNKPYAILGIRRDECGSRNNAKCLAFSGKKLKHFNPLVVVSGEWEDWFIETYGVEICDIYKPPYNFPRTGCKGCPFALNLQDELDTLERYFPTEYKQCEELWKPVYAEYRRLGYRLRKDGAGRQMTLDEVMDA